MAKKIQTTVALVAFTVIGAIFASNASATNGHQDHEGACARSTTSIPEGVSDLKFNGVLGQFANSVGIHGFDGSLTKQMNNQLIIGRIAKAVDTENTGCDGNGGTFSAGIRHLYKGESVALKAPPKFGKEACRHPNRKCKAIRIVVHVVFPTSCWNKNHEEVIVVEIWIRKPPRHKHHHHKHHKKPPICKQGTVQNGLGCSPQTNNAQQECERKGGNWNSNEQLCTIIQVNANCSNVTVVNGTGNVVNVYQEGNCNTETNQPPPPPPPGKPKILSVTKINDVVVGGTSPNFCASDFLPSGDSGTLYFIPEWGSFDSFSSGVAEFSVSGGTTEKCATYRAPGEVPPGGNERLEVVLVDGEQVVVNVQSFPIDPEPTRP